MIKNVSHCILLPYAQKFGIILCLENMPFRKPHSFSDIGEIKKVVSTLHHENVKACLDTGHSSCTQENVYECIITLGKDLETLHVHDDKRCRDGHLIPFQGEVDWNGFIRGLKEIEYHGCISLETGISKNIPEPMREQMQKALSGIARWFAEQIEEK